MSKARDFPDVSGAIIWARQIERKLQIYMKRVEDVLGAGWESHPEGKKLKEIGDAFGRKLNTQSMMEQWIKDIVAHCAHIEFCDRIFDIVTKRDRHG